MFSAENKVVCLSLLIDGRLGVYERKSDKVRVAYGDYCWDITDKGNWKGYLDGTINSHGCPISKKFLEEFSSTWNYIGRISPSESVANLKKIREHMAPNTILILILGSEISFRKNDDPVYDKREIYNVQSNKLICSMFAKSENVYFINTTEFIESQNDYTDSITHFKKYTTKLQKG